MMNQSTFLSTVYGINLSFLTAHEIDSAYWKEWELFHLPGGAPLFVLLHIPLMLAALWGYKQVLLGQKRGGWISLLLAGAGILGFIIHTVFIVSGSAQFKSVASISVLTGMLLVSLLLGIASTRWLCQNA
jgi:hypothetical protein